MSGTNRSTTTRRRGSALLTALVVALTAVVGHAGAVGAAPTTAAATPAGTRVTYGSACVVGAERIASGSDGALWYTSPEQRSISRFTTSGVITTFTDPRIGYALDIAPGPDGALWFTNPGATGIGRIAVDGTVSTFEDPNRAFPGLLAAGPDGAMWFTTTYGVGRVTLQGTFTTYTDPQITTPPDSLTLGPDGAMWWTSSQDDSIGRITTAGVITVFRDPAIHSPSSISAGPDGALWFTAGSSSDDVGAIGRITVAGVVSEIVDPGVVGPRTIVAGPDGAMWFTDADADAIGRVTMSGSVSGFTGNGPWEPGDMTVGPDGALWFVNARSDSIGRVSTAGVVTVPSGTCVRHPRALAAGPDGAMWFTNRGFGDYDHDHTSIGRIAPDGRVQEFFSPLLDRPGGLVAGPDGAMWFTNHLSIGRITMAGEISVFRDGNLVTAGSIAVGADGALWFTEGWRNSIGRITTAGVITHVTAAGMSEPTGITAGPDGALWFTNRSSDATMSSIGRVTTSGTVSIVAHPAIVHPSAITAGPDGALWFTTDSAIGRVTPAGAVTTFPVGGYVPGPLVAGADGSIWYVREAGYTRALGRITTTGEVAEVPEGDIGETLTIAATPDGGLWYSGGYSSGTSRTIGRMHLLGAPGPSGAVTATPAKGSVTVAWKPAPLTGGSPITAYSVVLSPGGQTCTRTPGQPLGCVFTAVTPGQPYTVAVTATSAAGAGATVVTDPVVPWSGSAYHEVLATRILDSRTGQGGWSGPLAAGANQPLQVTGVAGVPPTASTVVLNVTVTDASNQSYLAVWPAGTPRPTASSLNFLPGDTIANLVTVKVGTAGKVSFGNAVGRVDVIVDIVGYYDDGVGPGGLFTGIAPQRALDSRDPASWWGGHPLVAGEDDAVPIVGVSGVPEDESVNAVVINLTATRSSNDTFLTVWSASAQPETSNLNVRAGQTIANLVIVPIQPDYFHLEVSNAIGSVDVIIDVVGYFSTEHGSRFHPTAPTRILDNRNGTGLAGRWGPGQTRAVAVAGVNSLPANATGVVTNVTVTGSTTESLVSAFPHGVPRPRSSLLNFGAGQTIANAAYLDLGGGKIDLYNELGSVDIIADVSGYFGPD